jgi:5-methylcytosine-specific restriction endonuclease McrA
MSPELLDKAKKNKADHITPWHLGGKTLPENCQMLCKDDNRRKAGI